MGGRPSVESADRIADTVRGAMGGVGVGDPARHAKGLRGVLDSAASTLDREAPGSLFGLVLRQVPPGSMTAFGFAERARALAPEPGVVVTRPGEGRGGARYEAATGHHLTRPRPPDPSYDFLDHDADRRIALEGPLPQVGAIGQDGVDGLARAAVREAALRGGADLVVVDAMGLSDAQMEALGRALAAAVPGAKPIEVVR